MNEQLIKLGVAVDLIDLKYKQLNHRHRVAIAENNQQECYSCANAKLELAELRLDLIDAVLG